MARKPAINVDALVALGAGKLAQLVLDEAARETGFRKLVSAALAGTKGPGAVASLIDRRLAALERARGFIEWDRARTFAVDLEMTVKTIAEELGPADPAAAVKRLLRFIATHPSVFERVDDSQGGVSDVYDDAVAAMGALVSAMAEADRIRLPDEIASALANETHGYMARIVEAVAGHIPDSARAKWDVKLAARQAALPAERRGKHDWELSGRISEIVSARQALADARGDLDGLIALEEARHPNVQDNFAMAERLLAAGRAKEALAWIRRKSGPTISYLGAADLADGATARDALSGSRVELEARILDTLGDKAAARTLLWTTFELTLDARMLREHVARLDDFDEFDVLDRAFKHAGASSAIYHALDFFMDWPRLDFAARLVVHRRDEWDGRHYKILGPAATQLEADHPAAASILYRALLNDILTRAKSPAYGHGARYLARLDEMAGAFDASPVGIDGHAHYRAALIKAHGRKSGFWGRVHQPRQ